MVVLSLLEYVDFTLPCEFLHLRLIDDARSITSTDQRAHVFVPAAAVDSVGVVAMCNRLELSCVVFLYNTI